MSWLEVAIIGSVLLTGAMAVLYRRRKLVYRDLRRHQAAILNGRHAAAALDTGRLLPSFADRLAVVSDVLPADVMRGLAKDVERLGKTERSFVPTHKKGGTVAYETLCREAPSVVGLYLSRELHDLLGRIIGERVVPTPLHDQSSCSVLFYERPGDHIGWHYDHNFYKGRHFTVLLPIINRDASGDGLSAARLTARVGGIDREIPTPPNQLVVFEGAHVLHKATPIGEGERRVVLSMTFATDPRNSLVQGMARRLKDTAFFGVRALWT